MCPIKLLLPPISKKKPLPPGLLILPKDSSGLMPPHAPDRPVDRSPTFFMPTETQCDPSQGRQATKKKKEGRPMPHQAVAF